MFQIDAFQTFAIVGSPAPTPKMRAAAHLLSDRVFAMERQLHTTDGPGIDAQIVESFQGHLCIHVLPNESFFGPSARMISLIETLRRSPAPLLIAIPSYSCDERIRPTGAARHALTSHDFGHVWGAVAMAAGARIPVLLHSAHPPNFWESVKIEQLGPKWFILSSL